MIVEDNLKALKMAVEVCEKAGGDVALFVRIEDDLIPVKGIRARMCRSCDKPHPIIELELDGTITKLESGMS